MANDFKPLRWSLVPIPWWEGAFRLSVIVDRARVLYPDVSALPGTTLAEFKYAKTLPELIRVHGTWTFSEVLNGPGPGESMEFLWNPPRTEAQRLTPFKDYYTSRVHPWPAVLEDLQQVAGTYTHVLRQFLRDSVSVGCRVRVQHYASDIPFTRRQVRTNEPIATSVQGDINGVAVSIGACLHPTVILQTSAGGGTVYDAIPSRNFPLANGTKRYGATNHQRWKKHVFQVEVEEDKGLYQLVKLTIYPPRRQRISYAS
jgi:hypothetical protein